MPRSTDPSLQTSHDVDIHVCGLVPPALSGRLLGIGQGVVHSVELHPGRPVTYRNRYLRGHAGVHHIVAFNGTTLAFGDDLPAFELNAALDTLRPVDLAGQGRPLAPFPKHDPTTGELHVIAGDVGGTQAHVVISAGALTRRNRPIVDAPSRIIDLALTLDRVVFLSYEYAGISSREGECRTTWIATGVPAPTPLTAHDVGDAVVLVALTPMLERWTLHLADGNLHREVLEPRPRRFHDLVVWRHLHHELWSNAPGDFVFAADVTRPSDADGGWLLGFVHDASGATELQLIDAADITGPPITTARIPRPIPHGLRCTWIPSTR